MFFKHNLFLRMYLRCLYISLSGPGVDKILHLIIVLVNSSSKKEFYKEVAKGTISLRMLSLMHQSWAVLNDKCSACQKSFISKYGWPLYLTVSIAGNLHLLTQFMSFQGLHFLFAISWILRSKNCHFIFLTILWNCFQSSKLLDNLYFSKSLLQLLFHQLLEYLMMLTTFKFFSQETSTMEAKSLTALLRLAMSIMLEMLIFLMELIRSLMNVNSSSLFLMIEHLLEIMCSSIIGMMIVRGV